MIHKAGGVGDLALLVDVGVAHFALEIRLIVFDNFSYGLDVEVVAVDFCSSEISRQGYCLIGRLCTASRNRKSANLGMNGVDRNHNSRDNAVGSFWSLF